MHAAVHLLDCLYLPYLTSPLTVDFLLTTRRGFLLLLLLLLLPPVLQATTSG
jgi:hypothetical protein